MRVLVACEESQRVCAAFRERGHEAYSCDIQEPSGGHPEWHILGDVLEILNPHRINNIDTGEHTVGICFKTMDGNVHIVTKWDLIIAHPPCTFLSTAGACRLYPQKGIINTERYKLGLAAKSFFMKLYNASCARICVENPVPMKIFEMPPYTQIIQPYEHGEPYSKKTCLWLKGLPKLRPTKILHDYVPFVSCYTSKNKGIQDKQGASRAGGGCTHKKQNIHWYRESYG